MRRVNCNCDMPYEVYCDWLEDEGWDASELRVGEHMGFVPVGLYGDEDEDEDAYWRVQFARFGTHRPELEEYGSGPLKDEYSCLYTDWRSRRDDAIGNAESGENGCGLSYRNDYFDADDYIEVDYEDDDVPHNYEPVFIGDAVVPYDPDEEFDTHKHSMSDHIDDADRQGYWDYEEDAS